MKGNLQLHPPPSHDSLFALVNCQTCQTSHSNFMGNLASQFSQWTCHSWVGLGFKALQSFISVMLLFFHWERRTTVPSSWCYASLLVGAQHNLIHLDIAVALLLFFRISSHLSTFSQFPLFKTGGVCCGMYPFRQ